MLGGLTWMVPRLAVVLPTPLVAVTLTEKPPSWVRVPEATSWPGLVVTLRPGGRPVALRLGAGSPLELKVQEQLSPTVG